MQCIICHSPEIIKQEVNEEIHCNSDIVYVPIETPVCQNCGERYYDRKTMHFLERTKDQLKARNLKLRDIGKVKIVEL